MALDAVDFFSTPAAMTALPAHPALTSCPTDLGELRAVVQGLLIHRDWAVAYGVAADDLRMDEQNLRSTTALLERAFEISDDAVTVPRSPIDRVLCICRHYTLLHTALLRAHAIPARVRCGFSSYFDRSKWYDHWITERWNGERWVRDDPQIDDLQAEIVGLDFDPYDQPPGRFLTGGEAWLAARAGDLDPGLFGIFDMWGLAFIAGNVLSDVACLNKVELLPWDDWGIRAGWGPHDVLTAETCDIVDGLAHLSVGDDFGALRARYLSDDAVRVPTDITTVVNGEVVPVRLAL